jgi:hypothetical protein
MFVCTPVTPAVLYLLTGLAGCSVDPGISRGARKLAQTPRVIKKRRRRRRKKQIPKLFFP